MLLKFRHAFKCCLRVWSETNCGVVLWYTAFKYDRGFFFQQYSYFDINILILLFVERSVILALYIELCSYY